MQFFLDKNLPLKEFKLRTLSATALFANENDAQTRYYDKMAAPGCTGASVAERRKMRKQFSEEYYDKDKK